MTAADAVVGAAARARLLDRRAEKPIAPNDALTVLVMLNPISLNLFFRQLFLPLE